MARIKPLSGTDKFRIIAKAMGEIEADEITQTRDTRRAFFEADSDLMLSNPVWHGTKTTQGAMLAINTTSSRGCYIGDLCYRSDLNALMLCIANRGEAADDWFTFSLGGIAGGHWEPVTNGDPDNPEVLFEDGDIVMDWVTD